jgi:hypothetical protein
MKTTAVVAVGHRVLCGHGFGSVHSQLFNCRTTAADIAFGWTTLPVLPVPPKISLDSISSGTARRDVTRLRTPSCDALTSASMTISRVESSSSSRVEIAAQVAF